MCKGLGPGDVEALIQGETDAAVLADLALGRLRSKLPALEAALAGRIREHHRFMWRQLLHHLDTLNQELANLDAQIGVLTAPHAAIIERLDAIPGIDRRTAEVILAEIGPDVTLFPTAQHLASWACLCPGNNITGGKRRSGKTRRGQNLLRGRSRSGLGRGSDQGLLLQRSIPSPTSAARGQAGGGCRGPFHLDCGLSPPAPSPKQSTKSWAETTS